MAGGKGNEQDTTAALEQKVERLEVTVSSYREQLSTFPALRAERDLYYDLSQALAAADTLDSLLERVVTVLAEFLKARYCAVFWLDEAGERFEYRCGKGYRTGPMSAIRRSGSMMGKCIFLRSVTWEEDLRSKHDYIPLNQDPAEHDVLCAPIVLLGNDMGVIRIANIEPGLQDTANQAIRAVAPLVCATLERLLLRDENERRRSGLEVSVSIARLLENTLSQRDILAKVGARLPQLVQCAACTVAVLSDSGALRPVFSWPDKFALGGNPQSAVVYLRNLLAAFPDGTGMIRNIHRDRRWGWATGEYRSLSMVGLNVGNRLKGILVVLGPADGVFDDTRENLLRLVAVQTSITMERAAYFRRQEELARCDGLTGLLNHRVFQEALREEIERTGRYGRAVSLIMFDIDSFKKFNDTYGHQVGDEVLKMVAGTTRGVIRSCDRAYRYGGEEFCILLPECSPANAESVADRLRERVEANRTVKGLSVTISLGVSGFRLGDSAEQMVRRVDSALYESKDSGRNRVTVK